MANKLTQFSAKQAAYSKGAVMVYEMGKIGVDKIQKMPKSWVGQLDIENKIVAFFQDSEDKVFETSVNLNDGNHEFTKAVLRGMIEEDPDDKAERIQQQEEDFQDWMNEESVMPEPVG